MAKKKKPIKVYATYNYITDPRLEDIDAIIDERGAAISEAAAISGVAEGTLRNWQRGKTRRPQNMTMTAVERALGYVRPLQKSSALTGLLSKHRQKVKKKALTD